jgi:hypothetical protein
MVASPNVDFGGANGLANFLQDQQRQIDELGRRSTYPFSAGPGGTFQVYPDPSIKDATGQPVVDTVLSYATGAPALALKPGKPIYGSKQQMSMYDLAGNVMYRTDESAGYGLSAPLYNYQLSVTWLGTSSASNSANVEVVVAECPTPFYNPAIWARGLITMPNAIPWSARFAVTDGNTTVTSTTSNITGGSASVQKVMLLPANFIANQSTKLQLFVTPTAAGSTVTYPGTCVGVSKSTYDLNPGFQ